VAAVVVAANAVAADATISQFRHSHIARDCSFSPRRAAKYTRTTRGKRDPRGRTLALRTLLALKTITVELIMLEAQSERAVIVACRGMPMSQLTARGTLEVIAGPANPDALARAIRIAAAIPILFPWPSRVAGARFTFEGREYRLPVTNPLAERDSRLRMRARLSGDAARAVLRHGDSRFF